MQAHVYAPLTTVHVICDEETDVTEVTMHFQIWRQDTDLLDGYIFIIDSKQSVYEQRA